MKKSVESGSESVARSSSKSEEMLVMENGVIAILVDENVVRVRGSTWKRLENVVQGSTWKRVSRKGSGALDFGRANLWCWLSRFWESHGDGHGE